MGTPGFQVAGTLKLLNKTCCSVDQAFFVAQAKRKESNTHGNPNLPGPSSSSQVHLTVLVHVLLHILGQSYSI